MSNKRDTTETPDVARPEPKDDELRFDMQGWLGTEGGPVLGEPATSGDLLPNEIPRSPTLWVWVAGIGVFVALPQFITVTTAAEVMGLFFLMMFAMSWDIVSGYTGQLSLGHAFFFAIGGYGSAALNVLLDLSPLVSIPLATGLATLGGLLIGLPALRIKGAYLALLTLIAPFLLLRTFVLYSDVFGGTDGFTPLPDPLIGSTPRAVFTVDSFQLAILSNYYFTLFLTVAILLFLVLVTRSPIGQVFTAIRTDERVVTATGFSLVKYKLLAFLTSASVGGFAGAIFVHSMGGSPHPDEILTLELSINVIIFAFLGGIGTITGPVIGVLVFAFFLRFVEAVDVTIPVVGVGLSELQPIPLFVITILVIVFMRGGLVRWLSRTIRRLVARGRQR